MAGTFLAMPTVADPLPVGSDDVPGPLQDCVESLLSLDIGALLNCPTLFCVKSVSTHNVTTAEDWVDDWVPDHFTFTPPPVPSPGSRIRTNVTIPTVVPEDLGKPFGSLMIGLDTGGEADCE